MFPERWGIFITVMGVWNHVCPCCFLMKLDVVAVCLEGGILLGRTFPAFERKRQNFRYGKQVQCKFCILKLWLYELEKSSSCAGFLPGCTCSVLCHTCSAELSEGATDTCAHHGPPECGCPCLWCCSLGLLHSVTFWWTFSQCPYPEERKRMFVVSSR